MPALSFVMIYAGISVGGSNQGCCCSACTSALFLLLLCAHDRDQSPSFTAVRTAGLTGEVPSSPTSPRVKPPSSMFGSSAGNSPLLKAALNANLARISAQQQQQQQQQALSANGAMSGRGVGPGSLSGGMLSATGALTAGGGGAAGGGYGGGNQPGISSNVKQRLKEYFVARNTELVPSAAAAAGAAGLAACSDNGCCHQQQHGPMPMQH